MKVCNKEKPVIGMIHVHALPGTPGYSGDRAKIIEAAIEEAELYLDNGIDILMIENMHDVPYLKRNVGPEIVSLMSIILLEVKRVSNLPVGIQILAGANKEALAAAFAAGADFIRAEGFVFGHLADEGLFESDAGELLRYRKHIGAEQVQIFTDIKKKHSSHEVTKDVSVVETAQAAEFFLSDGVIITGAATGKKPSLEEIQSVKSNVNIPVIAGSGITMENVESYLKCCDALIIGSYFKDGGKWENPVDSLRVKQFMKKVNEIREKR